MNSRCVQAIVLAGGASTRMGTRNKLLKPWEGRALVVQSCQVFLQNKRVEQVFVVTGHDAARVRACFDDHRWGRRLNFAHAQDHAQGMSATLRAGVRRAQLASHLLVCLGDMPALKASTLQALLEASDAHPRHIVRPAHAGQPGHPVLFPAWAFERLLQIQGDQGARSLLRALPERVCTVEVSDPGVLLDLDTPRAFEASRK